VPKFDIRSSTPTSEVADARSRSHGPRRGSVGPSPDQSSNAESAVHMSNGARHEGGIIASVERDRACDVAWPRRSGTTAAIRSRIWAAMPVRANALHVAGVSIPPGETMLAVIPYGPSSQARARANAISATALVPLAIMPGTAGPSACSPTRR